MSSSHRRWRDWVQGHCVAKLYFGRPILPNPYSPPIFCQYFFKSPEGLEAGLPCVKSLGSEAFATQVTFDQE